MYPNVQDLDKSEVIAVVEDNLRRYRTDYRQEYLTTALKVLAYAWKSISKDNDLVELMEEVN